MNRVTRGLMRRCAGGRRVMLATGESGTPPAAGMEWIFATAISNRELANIAPKLNRGLATPPRLVYAGRLSPEKGVSVLITALARLKETGFTPLPLLSIAGDGPERLRLEREARDLGCRDRISFLGQLDRGALAVALHDSDVCVQPSLTEGFSKAWLDAMAHGVPVIASRVGAASSVIGECGERGWLVPPGNVDALADTLANVLSSSINWPLVRAACRTYVEQRTLERWAERIGSICARQWNVRFEAGRLHA
jgi:glycosyltransferase involved in cell wall biosynthesis